VCTRKILADFPIGSVSFTNLVLANANSHTRTRCAQAEMKNIPKLYDLSLEEINEPLILELIKLISEKREFVITPLNILGISGFPIANQTVLLNNKAKTKKIKRILMELKYKGIIEQRKSKQDYRGIKETAYNLIKKNNQNKSIEQLENDYWKESSEFPTDLVERCYRYRKINISKLTNEQIRLLISQNIGIEYLIGIVLKKLEQNILTECDFYEGDLLIAVSGLPTEYWNENKTEFWAFKNLVERNSELIKTELGEKKFDRINEIIKASAQQRV